MQENRIQEIPFEPMHLVGEKGLLHTPTTKTAIWQPGQPVFLLEPGVGRFDPALVERMPPVNQMSWEEEVVELQKLVSGVLIAQKERHLPSVSGFSDMFEAWKGRMARYGLYSSETDYTEVITTKIQASLEEIEKQKVRPARLGPGGELVYRGFRMTYSPRELRSGIRYFGIDGHAKITYEEVAARESMEHGDRIVDKFTKKSITYMQHDWNRRKLHNEYFSLLKPIETKSFS